MADLLSFLMPAPSEEPFQHFREVRLGESPTYLRIVDFLPERVQLHWIDGPPLLGYVHCPGARCPACRVGMRPSIRTLMLAFNFDQDEVQVLGVPMVVTAASLASALAQHLTGAFDQKILAISHDARKRYTVQPRPIPEALDRGDGQIEAALVKLRAGLTLGSIYRSYSADELAELPDVARRLVVRGGDTSEEDDDARA